MEDTIERKLWDDDPYTDFAAVIQSSGTEKAEQEIPPVEMTTEEAVQLVQDSLAKIEQCGWVLWRLRNVRDSKGVPRKICLLRDYTVNSYPPGYPRFSLDEFEKLPEDMSNKTMNRLIHIKVNTDARIESVEKNDWGTV
jgi:hypothetical protein